ncbi:MAG: hypothetical protein J7L35_10165, partial [Anaerolineales bacterium]|nr:hypothetical protein [Anaerolineales bacterium]
EEDDLFSGDGWEEEAHELVQEYSGPAVGAEAVDKADAESNLRSAESVPQAGMTVDLYSGEVQQPKLKYVGDKTFFLQGEIWIDSLYDAAAMTVTDIGFRSDVYYQLLTTRPEWGKYFALGKRVIFVVDGEAYQVVSEEQGISSLPSRLSVPESNSGASADGGVSAARSIRSLCSTPFLTGLVMLVFGLKTRP